jgi:hypothetical protein
VDGLIYLAFCISKFIRCLEHLTGTLYSDSIAIWGSTCFFATPARLINKQSVLEPNTIVGNPMPNALWRVAVNEATGSPHADAALNEEAFYSRDWKILAVQSADPMVQFTQY